MTAWSTGKVAEHWFQLDGVTLFEQLGLRLVPGPRLLPAALGLDDHQAVREAAAQGPVISRDSTRRAAA
jgi:hypothetical protein